MATTYSLLNALTALDSLRRERLDRLVCIPAPAAGTPLVWCHQHPAVGAAPFGGEITDAVPLADQVAALTETGLWGAVALADPDGEGAREVRLWAGKGERAAWDKRVTLSLRSARAGEVLAAGGDVKLATWRRQIAMDRLEGAVWDIADEAPAEGGGVLSRSDLVTLSQTARATVLGRSWKSVCSQLIGHYAATIENPAPQVIGRSGVGVPRWAQDRVG